MNKQKCRLISKITALAFTVSLCATAGTKQANAAVTAAPNTTDVNTIMTNALKKTYSADDELNKINSKYGKDLIIKQKDPAKSNPNDIVRVIVQLTDKPLAEEGSKGLDSIQAAQATVKSKVKALQNAEIRHTYTNVVNGFSMKVKRSEIEKIKAIQGVESVREVNVYYPDMNSAKTLTQAYDTWKDYKIKGEGMVVSIIDTGIDWTHKDMNLTDKSKEKLTKDSIKSGDPGKFFTDKVPYGYNFAEINTNVIPADDNPHGMHVAGIVGANTKDEEGPAGVKGVAPECQLLAMKVFANDPAIGGAYSDDIVAAIESSVTHGADVINMSLGSNAGFQDADEPEQVAIKNATDKGVMVVVSGGNSQYSTAPYKFAEVYDTGVVGSPGVAADSLQVSSYENSNLTATSFAYTDGSATKRVLYAATDAPKDPAAVFSGQQMQIVDCGQGFPSDFQGKDLKGKIAAVEWGHGLGSVALRTNVGNAGAAGALIYGPVGDESMHSMVVNAALIPAAWVSHSNGVMLKSGSGSILFDGKLGTGPNPNANDMSDFTSWGPAPSLDFKPEVSAPGGNIWSTVTKNGYENMSGTSMASPHTAGAEALIIEEIKKENPKLSGRELVEFAKATTVNTATPLMDKKNPDVPYSPRRQGSGLLQIENAIKNKVTVKDANGRPTIALKEIGTKKDFTFTLKNYGSQAITYDIKDFSGVLTEQSDFLKTMSYDVKVNGAKITFDTPNNKVTVLPGKTATVKATITLPSDTPKDKFIEGFITFQAANQPNLVIPYMGFYGNWSDQPSIDAPMWSENSLYGKTKFFSLENDNNTLDYLGYVGSENGQPKIDPDKIAISPNSDGVNDNVLPFLTMLRNAKNLSVRVLDKDHKLLAQVATDDDVRKNVFAASGDTGYKTSTNWKWDGTLYNAATGKKEAAKPGQYYLDYVTKVDIATAKEQHFEIPVKVDLTAPVIKLDSPTNTTSATYKLVWEATDDLSGVLGTVVVLNGEISKSPITKNPDNTYSCDLTLDANKVNKVSIGVEDFAGNLATKEVTVNQGLPFELTFDNLTSRMNVDKTTLKVTGKVNYIPGQFKINGKDVKINADLTFSTDLTFVDGRNLVAIYVVDTDGVTVLKDFSYKVDCDCLAPTLDANIPVYFTNGNDYTAKVAGTVWDNGAGYQLFLNGEEKLSVALDGTYGKDATLRPFLYDVNVTPKSNIQIKAVDLMGHETVKNFVALEDKSVPVVTISGVEDGASYNSEIDIKYSASKGKVSATLKNLGTLSTKNYSSGTAIKDNGKYELTVTYTDSKSNTYTVTRTFTIDKSNGPTITVSGVEDGKYYNKDVKPTVKVNQSNVKTVMTLDGKDYSGKAITAEGAHTLVITATNSANNSSTVTISFIIDKTKPVITINGVAHNKSYTAPVIPTIVKENPGDVVVATLNGKSYTFGTAIAEKGIYTLKVTVTDKAGNSDAKMITFTIK